MTSRWSLEVAKVREVEVKFHPMSLNFLNRDKDISDDYRALMDRALAPMRIVTAAIAEHGDEIAEPLYTAIGNRIHPGGEKDFDKARSEERRVGKERRDRWAGYHENKKRERKRRRGDERVAS